MRFLKFFLNFFAAFLLTSSALAQLIEGTSAPGLSTDKNYIYFGDAELAKKGWVCYTSSGARPVPGETTTTGASLISIDRSTTDPIEGKYSWVITKASGNAQGQGCYYEFKIDRGDRAKGMQIDLSYNVVSGDFVPAETKDAESDLIYFIMYKDPADNIWKPLEPSTYKFFTKLTDASTDAPPSNFTSPLSRDYRLVVRAATTSTNPYAIRLDRTKVKRSQYLAGTPFTDWSPYNLVVGATTTAPSQGLGATKSAIWRRAGDSAEIIFYYYQTAAGNSGSGTYLFPLPSGLSADSGKITFTTNAIGVGGHPVGEAFSADTNGGGANYAGQGKVYVYNSGNLLLATSVAGGQITNLSSTHSTNFQDTIFALNFKATVPIQGWSSSTQMSDSIVWVNDVGSIQAFSTAPSYVPEGYLYADGRAVSRATYAELFRVIGTNYGSGDGTTTFNLPDYRGSFLRGVIAVNPVTGTGSVSSNNATFTSHGIVRTGMKVRLVSGTLSGLTVGTDYFAIVVDNNTLAFATTTANALAGTKIALTGSNTGVVQQWMDPDVGLREAMAPGGNTGSSVGSIQYDALQNITGSFSGGRGANSVASGAFQSYAGGGSDAGTSVARNHYTMDASRVARTSSETRSTNVSVSYYIKYARTASPVISAAETPVASYYASANNTTSPTAPINFDTKIEDNFGSVVTGSGWRYYAPHNGLFKVTVIANNTTGSTDFYIYKNGVKDRWIGALGNYIFFAPVEIRLKQNEYIDIRANASMTVLGGALASGTIAQIYISRVGL